MSGFTFQVIGDAAAAEKAIKSVIDGLGQIENKAAQASKAMKTVSLPGAPGGKSGGLMAGVESLGGKLAAGAVAAGAIGTVKALAAIDDQYIKLSNSAMKFADAGHSVHDILDEQRELAHDLHSGMEETIGAYDAVRDATDGLNLTHAEQIRVTKTLGQAAQMGGKSMESAAQAMQNLSVAFETGQDPARALRGIFKQFPDLTEQMTSAFGVSKKELLDMASSGQISFEDLTRSMTRATDEIDRKFGERTKTWGQKWHEFADAVERPISVDRMLAPFGTLDQAINRVADDVAKLTARWEALEARARPTGAYTATRLDTGADIAKRIASDRVNAVQGAKLELEGLNQAYSEGWLTVDLYNERKEALMRIINGTTAATAADAQATRDYAQALEEANAAAREWMDRDKSVTGGIGSIEGLGDPSGGVYSPGALETQREISDEKNRAMLSDFRDSQNKKAEAAAETARRIAEDEKKAAQEVQEAWASGLGSIAGELIQMTAAGDVSFDKLAKQLAILAIQMAAMQMGGPGGAFLGQLVGGFAHGGIIHEGNGGTDSQLVAFRKSPNERVTIETPEQQRTGSLRGSGSGMPAIHIHMANDRRDLVSAMDSREGAAMQVNLRRRFGT
jgi:tape measure domain-containing protein